jgi:predicted nucleic acid-binding Zn ribbon protein
MIDEEERIATKDAMSSKQLIDIFLSKLKVENLDDCSITLNWKKIVQGEYYKHLKVKEIKFNTVIVIADHPAWAQKANMSKNTMLKKIQKEFPLLGIKAIKIICS